MKIITTGDGSHTLFTEQFNEFYHSNKGAITESQHVFIQAGLDYALDKIEKGKTLRIFELSFGTGLNALLTMLEGEKRNVPLYYETIELYPVPIEIIKELNYTSILGFEHCYGPYHTMHLCTWGKAHPITPIFQFKKVKGAIEQYLSEKNSFDLIYFDAFAPEQQPEMWSGEIIRKMYDLLAPGGILVSYSSKSAFQTLLKDTGFKVEKLPGPPGKREMVRAFKK